jgi:hypothetical protein
MTKARLVALLPFCLGMALGCGGSSNTPGKVEGKITYNGTALGGGTIRFESPSGGGVYGAGIKPDGTYSITDMSSGDMVVTIETESINPNKQIPSYGGAPGDPMSKAMAPRAELEKQGVGKATSGGNYVKIPDKYNNPQTSGLKVTVGKGNQTENFTLTD